MHSISDPSRVRFTGPLVPFRPGLVEELASLGYARSSSASLLQVAAHLSRWLEAAGIGLDGLSEPVMIRFLLERRNRGSHHYSLATLEPMLRFLRRVGAVPREPLPVAGKGEVELLLDRFARYLSGQRALSAPVVAAYVRWVRPFTIEVLCPGGVGRDTEVSAGEVAGFMAARLPRLSRKSAQMTACALRSLLRFLHAEAIVSVSVSLVEAVPAVASWRLSGLPQALTGEQVQALLGACDPSTSVGRRDRAVITFDASAGITVR